ncbi:hypothetical protein FB451DRAFT_1164697 [Mycena latifolia]|nr:hypothetical protein FB451DRAFT_1164697 [Mycena latifolia]
MCYQSSGSTYELRIPSDALPISSYSFLSLTDEVLHHGISPEHENLQIKGSDDSKMALSSSTLQFVLLLAVYGYQYQSKCYGTPPSPFLPPVLTVLGCTTKDIPNGHPVTWSPDGSDRPKPKQWLAAKVSE